MFTICTVLALGELCTQKSAAAGSYRIYKIFGVLLKLLDSPSARVGHNDTVVDTEGIFGETGDVPSLDLDGLAKGLAQGKLGGAWDLFGLRRERGGRI